ncbi:MAG: methylated-DNA--[protein]-cysteine S-methyltransferase [Bacteroidales bacterium]|nr:methylated-DNA--[protein]-cysteine S-methyltransferase [Bacteroidales bacterium]
MNLHNYTNYSQISELIKLINPNLKEQLSLEEIASKVGLSSDDLRMLFIDWAGVEPNKFFEYVSIQHAKQVLNKSQATLFDAGNKTALSDKEILHVSLVEIEEMSSEEYQKNLSINYSFAKNLFGEVLVASTHKGICYIGFSDDKHIALSDLEKRFSKASFTEQIDDIQHNALQIFTQDWSKINKIKLHLKGTNFQMQVWKALLEIPKGSLTTYGNIAEIIQKPKAARAVGTAIGSNPVSFLIPCHRVIQSSGVFGGYMWGTIRKTAIIGWEAARIMAL